MVQRSALKMLRHCVPWLRLWAGMLVVVEGEEELGWLWLVRVTPALFLVVVSLHISFLICRSPSVATTKVLVASVTPASTFCRFTPKVDAVLTYA